MEVVDGEKERSVRKVVLACGEDVKFKPALLERSGVCTSRGEESRHNKNDGLESRHVVLSKYLQGKWV